MRPAKQPKATNNRIQIEKNLSYYLWNLSYISQNNSLNFIDSKRQN
jgi:hypothetical protein